MLKSLVALVAVLAATVSAQTPPITVTQPLTDFTVTAGTNYVIAWVNPVVSNISQIWLAQGSSTSLTKTELVAQNVPTAPLSYTWAVDPKLAAGQYSLEFGLAPNIAYAGPFNIVAAGSAPPASGASSAAAGNATATDSAPPAPAATSSGAAASPAAASPSSSPSAANGAATPSTSASAPAATTTKANDAKMVAPVALLALIPAVVAFL